MKTKIESYEQNLNTRADQEKVQKFNAKINELTDNVGANESLEVNTLFFLGKNDQGVVRNGGRRGARYAPDAIVNSLRKMIAPKNDIIIGAIQTCSPKDQGNDFELFQNSISQKISQAIINYKNVSKYIHIGGGHDHVFPFLKALNEQSNGNTDIIVINIDAHLDTRSDPQNHSGTPFRQFARLTKENNTNESKFHLYQLGIHSIANVADNFDMENMKIYEGNEDAIVQCFHDIEKRVLASLQQPKPDTDMPIVILSLDCDALDSSFMKGVSAVNGKGFTKNEYYLILEKYLHLQKLFKLNKMFYGIYEYNPVYDDLSSSGAKFLAHTINTFLEN